MNLNRYIARQLSKPTGVGGKLILSVMNRQNRPLYDETSRLLELSNSDSVLDIGCGNAYMLHMLARQYACRLTGIDISMSMIENASRRYRKFVKDGKMAFSCQNAEAMSFADASFHKAYTVNTVYFWDSLDKTMSEIRRILKAEGLFINTLFSNETLSRFSHTRFGYKRFAVEELISAGHTGGFDVTVIPILNDTAYCIVYQKAA